MDFDQIKERILEFLRIENKSSAHFAQEIGVQPSAISHIISGRNKPSLDFVMKMISKYPSLSVEWLLLGKGSMYSGKLQSDLFSGDIESGIRDKDALSLVSPDDTLTMESDKNNRSGDNDSIPPKTIKKIKRSARIIVFYDDNTFTEHFPGGE